MGIRFYLSILALILCAGPSQADEFSDILAANQAKWRARQPAHYSYRHGQSCFCMAVTWQIEVENGTIREIKPVVFGSLPPTPNNLGIDSVFEWVRQAKARNPDELKVTYDAEFGFPSGIRLDGSKQIDDDEISIGISLFKVLPPGISLNRDTVYTRNWPGVTGSQDSVRITNTGDQPLYLNRIELAVSPTDTFPNFGASLAFTYNLPGEADNVPGILLRKVNPAGMTDTIAELSGVLLPPGGSLRLSRFSFDPCFCLVKAGAKIADGDPVTLMLRLYFSRGVEADRADVRADVWVRAINSSSTGIARPALRSEKGVRGNAGPGRVTGLFTLGDRVFRADGRNPALNGGAAPR